MCVLLKFDGILYPSFKFSFLFPAAGQILSYYFISIKLLSTMDAFCFMVHVSMSNYLLDLDPMLCLPATTYLLLD